MVHLYEGPSGRGYVWSPFVFDGDPMFDYVFAFSQSKDWRICSGTIRSYFQLHHGLGLEPPCCRFQMITCCLLSLVNNSLCIYIHKYLVCNISDGGLPNRLVNPCVYRGDLPLCMCAYLHVCMFLTPQHLLVTKKGQKGTKRERDKKGQNWTGTKRDKTGQQRQKRTKGQKDNLHI